MKRKYLYALALLLCLSTVAFSKERARDWFRTSGHTNCPAASSVIAKAGSTETAAINPENHVLLQTFIKLLYI